MTKTLRISSSVELPLNAVTQKLAFLGISGSGKTYAAGKFAEELLDAGAQVVVIDTVGNWYGLRLAADGKKPGISIPILGGAKGDVPLEASHGRLVAETIAGSRASMIVDVSDFTKSEMLTFALHFSTELLRLKKRAPSPVMIIWEECQEIVPQRVFGEQARTVGAVERLIKKGRNYGIGTTLISQRPAAVNKDVLSQVETLFAFRLNGKHDRKQIRDWIVEKDLDIASLVDELPKMKTGSAYLWSPQWLETFEIIKFSKKRTFDASATPNFDSDIVAGALAPVDLEKFKKTMGGAIEKARTNNPEVLQARIEDLGEGARREACRDSDGADQDPKIIEKLVLKEKDLVRLERLASRAADTQTASVRRFAEEQKTFVEALNKFRETLAQAHGRLVVAHVQGLGTLTVPKQVDKAALSRREYFKDVANGRDTISHDGNGLPALSKPEQRVLDAISWFNALQIEMPEKVAVAFMAGYKGENGTFNNIVGKLRTNGLVHYPQPGFVALTETGRAVATEVQHVSVEALQTAVLMRLEIPQRRVLVQLIDAYPKAVDKEDLAKLANYGGQNGTFNNIVGRLRTLGLIHYPARGVAAARPILFGQ